MQNKLQLYLYALFITILMISLISITLNFLSLHHFILTFFISFTVVLGATLLHFVIKRLRLNKTLCFTLLVICVTLRLPTIFMLRELDLAVYSPLFNLVFTLCTVTSIAHLNAKEITAIHLAFTGFFALTLPFLVLYLSKLDLNLDPYLTLASLLIFEILGDKHILDSSFFSKPGPVGGIGSSSSGNSGGGGRPTK